MNQAPSKPTTAAVKDTIKPPAANPPEVMPTMLVEVSAVGDAKNGASVFDAFPRFFPIDIAAKFVPSLRQMSQVTAPTLSGRPVPTEQDVVLMQRYEQTLASMPKEWPVQREHGNSFREAGIWAVSGPNVLKPTYVVHRDRDGHWIDAPGTTWDGPYMTVEEARVAHGLPELPKAPANVTAAKPGMAALRTQVAELERQLADFKALEEARKAQETPNR